MNEKVFSKFFSPMLDVIEANDAVVELIMPREVISGVTAYKHAAHHIHHKEYWSCLGGSKIFSRDVRFTKAGAMIFSRKGHSSM